MNRNKQQKIKKALADSTNIPPQNNAKNVHLAVNPEIASTPSVHLLSNGNSSSLSTLKSSSTVNSFFTKQNPTSAMSASTAALKNPVNNFLIEETQKVHFENNSDISETESVIDISDDEVLKPDLALKSQMMSNNVITMTSDYKLKVNGKIVDQWDEETIRVAKELNLKLYNLSEKNAGDKNGYLWDSTCEMHLKLGNWKKQADYDKLASEGFIGSIEDLNKVCHLDDNPHNIKLSNLMNLPSQWNQAFRKPKGGNSFGNNWYSSVEINGSDSYTSVYVKNEEEALVQRDINLIKHCKEHISVSPDLAQDYIFRYGLVRPAKYVKLGWYVSIESLISHSGDWVKDITKHNRKGQKYVKSGRFHIVDNAEDFTEAAKQAIRLSSPMDDSFICFEYRGERGKTLQRLCNRNFYEAVVIHFLGNVGEIEGYMVFNGTGSVHNLALEFAQPGCLENGDLKGLHGKNQVKGPDGKVDCRSRLLPDGSFDPLLMHPGSHSQNMSEIDLNNPNGYPGVNSDNGGKSFYSKIYFGKFRYRILTNPDKIAVASTYAYLHDQRSHIEGLQKLNPLTKEIISKIVKKFPKEIHPKVVARKAELEADRTILEKLAKIQTAKKAAKDSKKRIREADPDAMQKISKPKASSSKSKQP